jgi:hypothetical protein
MRAALDPGTEAASGVSARAARDTVETARALGALHHRASLGGGRQTWQASQ